MRRLNYLALSGLFLGFLACSSDNAAKLDGDPTQATFEMKLSSSASSSSAAAMNAAMNSDGSFDLGSSGVTITSGSVNVEKIELELPDGMSCADAGFVAADGVRCKEEVEVEDDGMEELEAEIEFEGPIVFDLLTGASNPDLGSISLPSGMYKEIEIELHEAEPSDGLVDEGDPLAGNTIVADGTFVDADGVSHGFHLAIKFTEELEIEDEAGVAISEDTISNLVVGLDVEQWLAGVDLAQCVQDGDLTIDSATDTLVIDEATDGNGSCGDVEGTIKENIKNSFELDDDDDSDDEDDDRVDDFGGIDP